MWHVFVTYILLYVVTKYAHLGCISLHIAAMQQFAPNALFHESLHAADVSLQNLAASAKWAWFSFKR